MTRRAPRAAGHLGSGDGDRLREERGALRRVGQHRVQDRLEGEDVGAAMERVEKEGKGVILYMNQEGRGIGLLNKLKAYQLQESGMDTVEIGRAHV